MMLPSAACTCTVWPLGEDLSSSKSGSEAAARPTATASAITPSRKPTTMTRKKVPNRWRARDGFGGGLRAGIFGAVNPYPVSEQAIGADLVVSDDSLDLLSPR